MEHSLQVGFGRLDIMPQGPIELGGLGNGHQRVSEQILDVLMATCIAVTDADDRTLLMLELDLVELYESWMDRIRAEMSRATGVPAEQILTATSHTHSGPDVGHKDGHPPRVEQYLERVCQRAAQAAQLAMADRKPTQVYAARGETEGLNFVRHYRRADGSCGRPTKDNPGVGHTTQADPTLQLVRFARDGGRDILMMNWQAHATFNGKSFRKDISADYVGYVRSYMEMMCGCDFIFIQGASGNLTGNSLMESEHAPEDMVRYGKRLGDAALALLPELKPVAAGPLQFEKRMFRAMVNHSKDADVETAQKVWDFWLGNGKLAESWPMAQAHGYNTPYAAQSVLIRAQLGEYIEMELNTVSMGELAFATAPCEMFDSCGAQVRDNSPFGATLIVTFCNGYHDYFPTRYAFEYGCYEADSCRFEPGAAEAMAQELSDMLCALKTEPKD